jgi:hypothetical protein
MTTNDIRLAIGRYVVAQAEMGTLTAARLNAAVLALRALR